MRKMTEEAKRQEEEFLKKWEKESYLKQSLLYILTQGNEFRALSNKWKVEFLLLVLQENIPQKSNNADVKNPDYKEEIFKKAFMSLFKLGFNSCVQYSEDYLENELLKFQKTKILLEILEKIPYTYDYDNFTNDLFFKNPYKKELSYFLGELIKCDPCQNLEKLISNYQNLDTTKFKRLKALMPEVKELVIKIIIQSLNTELLKKHYIYGLEEKNIPLIAQMLKEEYCRFKEIISEGFSSAKKDHPAIEILKNGKISEQIPILIHRTENKSWIPLLLLMLALNGDFDEIEI